MALGAEADLPRLRTLDLDLGAAEVDEVATHLLLAREEPAPGRQSFEAEAPPSIRGDVLVPAAAIRVVIDRAQADAGSGRGDVRAILGDALDGGTAW